MATEREGVAGAALPRALAAAREAAGQAPSSVRTLPVSPSPCPEPEFLKPEAPRHTLPCSQSGSLPPTCQTPEPRTVT